ncbi:MAG: hypothetical protein RL377_744 [Bacteroidota bacterium]|jgi:hypothetical protein
MIRNYLVIFCSLLLASCAQSNYSKMSPVYEKEAIGEVPDYSQLVYWAAHPDKKNPSDSVPSDLLNQYHPNKQVDVFFVYPTSYLDSSKPYGWNASLKDVKTNIYTDYTSILYQASVFNEVGKIYAPRYRQAHIKCYTPIGHEDTVKAIAAFELAYQDVKKAFEYYLANYNHGNPIIIASHSQGSTHTIRILKEYFDNKPLAKQLVAAYVVGMALDPGIYTSLKACTQPNETGCICAWRTFMEGYQEPFVDKEKFNSIVTNPLSWSATDTNVSRRLNEGTILYDFNKIKTGVAGAINHKGVLWTPKPHFMGSFLLKTKNYHIADYNFYYKSIRNNAAERVNAFMSTKQSSTSR